MHFWLCRLGSSSARPTGSYFAPVADLFTQLFNRQARHADRRSSNAPGSTAAASNSLTDLINERGDDQSQVSQLQAQVGQALTQAQSSDAVSSVLDPAALVPVSAKKVVLVDGLSGLIAGLAIGLAIVIFGALFSEEVSDRYTVAETLGGPITLSIAAIESHGSCGDADWPRACEHRIRNPHDRTADTSAA